MPDREGEHKNWRCPKCGKEYHSPIPLKGVGCNCGVKSEVQMRPVL